MNEELLTENDYTELNEAQEPIIELSEQSLEHYDSLCRLCGTRNDNLVPIYSEEGISNELARKINLYLPIKVSDTDSLPLQCCIQCASTILTWHEYFEATIDADKRLRDLQTELSKVVLVNEDSCGPGPSCDLPEPEQEIDEDIVETKEEIDESYRAAIQPPPLISLEKMRQSAQKSLRTKKKTDPIIWIKPQCDLTSDEKPSERDPLSDIAEKRQKRGKINQEAIDKAKISINGRVYYNCGDCGKNLHSPYTYTWHTRIHTGERPYVCDLCGKQFRVSQGLVRHLRETHAGIKNFPCDICGRNFATRRNVEEHRRIHTNERPYICDLCGKSFKQKASLFVHGRSHTDTFPYKCTYCEQAFRTKPPMLVHLTRHTGEKPYACDVCGRCFRIKYELKRHRLIHSDDKPFSCEDCGLSFRQKRYLRNHNKVNHNRLTP